MVSNFEFNVFKFKNFFGERIFSITKPGQYSFTLKGDVLLTRINWFAGHGQLDLTFSNSSSQELQ